MPFSGQKKAAPRVPASPDLCANFLVAHLVEEFGRLVRLAPVGVCGMIRWSEEKGEQVMVCAARSIGLLVVALGWACLLSVSAQAQNDIQPNAEVKEATASDPTDVSMSEVVVTPTAGTSGEPTPTVTPTPISEKEFRSRLSEWVFVDFLQIGDFKEATVNNLSTGDSWRVQDGDIAGDLRVISVGGEAVEVNIGGREGKLLPIEKVGDFFILEEGMGGYSWNPEEGAPLLMKERAFRGRSCFKSTGNNRLNVPAEYEWRIGVGGDAYSRINIAVMPLNQKADILFQVRGEKQWWTRWAFDAEKSYQSGYSWAPRGATTNLQPNRWHYFSIHLLDDLGFKEGDRVLELAFSSRNKDVLFDSVSLSRQIPAGAKAVRSPR
jgi:hypothetical protein